MTDRKRPLGVSVLAILLGLVGVILFLPLLFRGVMLTQDGMLFLGLFTSALPTAMIAGAVGLWRTRSWGYYTAIISLFMVGFLNSQAVLLNAEDAMIARVAVVLAIPFAGIAYLALPRTRRIFLDRGSGDAEQRPA